MERSLRRLGDPWRSSKQGLRLPAMQGQQNLRINLDPSRYSRDVILTLPPDERDLRLREMEFAANSVLSRETELAVFQESLYLIIEQLLCERLGYLLGRWDYDCEIEIWGGSSYMDQSLPDELTLKSECPNGIMLNWGEFEFPETTD